MMIKILADLGIHAMSGNRSFSISTITMIGLGIVAAAFIIGLLYFFVIRK